MLSEKRVDAFDDILDGPAPIRSSLEQLLAGNAPYGTASQRAQRSAAENKVVRPAAFSQVERSGRNHALNALKTIIKAADVCKNANQESQRQANRASEIARRAIVQLEIANEKLAASDEELNLTKDSLRKMEDGIVAQLHESSHRNAQLQSELDSRNRDMVSLRQLLDEMKTELLASRQRASALEAELDIAQEDLHYVTEITCEALQVQTEA